MNLTQENKLIFRVSKLKDEIKIYKEKVSALKKENKNLQKHLRDKRNLINNIPGAVVFVQREKILFINASALNQLGYVEEEMVGEKIMRFVHPDSFDTVLQLHKKRISGKMVQDRYETYLTSKTDERLCYEVIVKKVIYQGRRAFLLNLINIDERKKKEEQARQAHKNEALAHMASSLSHQWRDCLTLLDVIPQAIHVNGSKMEKTTPHDLEKIHAFRQKGEEITELLEGICRTEMGDSTLAPIDLRKVVKEAVASIRPQLDGSSDRLGVKFRIRTYLRTLTPLKGRPDELKHVCVNMILNAVEALPKGGDIYITTEENPDFAHMYIQDNGVGIPKTVKEKIFDPFFTTQGDRRLGIGLSLVQAIVARHNGTIEVLSREGIGSTFTIKIPLPQKTKEAHRRVKRKQIKNSHLLIISNEEISKDLLSTFFIDKGGKVTVSSGALEGMNVIKKEKIDIAIADLNVLNPDSNKIIKKMKREGNGFPIVLINSSKNIARRELQKLDVDLVIGRPLEMDRISSLISNILPKNVPDK